MHPKEWAKEEVQPDIIDVTNTTDRHWSSERGGCEGTF